MAVPTSPITPGMNITIVYEILDQLTVFLIIISTNLAPSEKKSIGVNTPSTLIEQATSPGSSSRETQSRGASSYSFLLGNEEEQLQAMLRELLAAFPTQIEQSESSADKRNLLHNVYLG